MPVTDEELICEFMERKPEGGRPSHGSNEVWWRWGWRYIGPSKPQEETPHEYCWLPRRLTLDALWEVEARLTDEQGQRYVSALGLVWPRDLLMASAAKKIQALASVLRAAIQKETA